MWRDSLTNPELEFIAESTLIYIVPNFRKDAIQLISGTFGPFRPNKTIQVPLWLAIQFRKNKKCTIKIPDYLKETYLTETIENEKETKGTLIQLPNSFFEIAQILLNQAEEDFTNLKEVRGLVEDLLAIRIEKINQMLEAISPESLCYKIDAFNDKEIEQIRPFLNSIFPMRLQLTTAKKDIINDGTNDLFCVPNNNNENMNG